MNDSGGGTSESSGIIDHAQPDYGDYYDDQDGAFCHDEPIDEKEEKREKRTVMKNEHGLKEEGEESEEEPVKNSDEEEPVLIKSEIEDETDKNSDSGDYEIIMSAMKRHEGGIKTLTETEVELLIEPVLEDMKRDHPTMTKALKFLDEELLDAIKLNEMDSSSILDDITKTCLSVDYDRDLSVIRHLVNCCKFFKENEEILIMLINMAMGLDNYGDQKTDVMREIIVLCSKSPGLTLRALKNDEFSKEIKIDFINRKWIPFLNSKESSILKNEMSRLAIEAAEKIGEDSPEFDEAVDSLLKIFNGFGASAKSRKMRHAPREVTTTSPPSDTLILSNVPDTMTVDTLRDQLSHFGHIEDLSQKDERRWTVQYHDVRSAQVFRKKIFFYKIYYISKKIYFFSNI
eukprot:GHVL01037317.1.p1 GENE.GHVL01037317.1~~GHVL01037317.1.p1  ORF type:complete len:402 (-),score=108.30 GHVL01037317.1:160-1365(-)